MYWKAASMLHMIRNVLDNDEKWRSILRGLNQTFRHSTVTTEEIENYVSEQAKIDFSTVFEQYLRHTKIPAFAYSRTASTVHYHFKDVVDGFTVRTKAIVDGKPVWITPTTVQQMLELPTADSTFAIDRNFYFEIENVDKIQAAVSDDD